MTVTKEEKTKATSFSEDFLKCASITRLIEETRLALAALDKAYGYTAPYGSENYISWDNRKDDYKTIYRSLDTQFDLLWADQEELTFSVMKVFSLLDLGTLSEITELVEENLSVHQEAKV